eukprot:1150781-Pelagomonas_calceolata.AAC.5
MKALTCQKGPAAGYGKLPENPPEYKEERQVGAMNQAAKSAVRGVKYEINALGCSSEPATEQASHPQATSDLEAALQPKVNMLGAAGSNSRKLRTTHKPVAV